MIKSCVSPVFGCFLPYVSALSQNARLSPVLVLCVSVCSCPVLFPSCVCFPPVSSFVSFEPINHFFVSPLFWSESTFGSSPCKVFVLLIKLGLVKSLLFLCLIIYLGYLFILKGKQVAVCGFQA